jgi:hypothetical protein
MKCYSKEINMAARFRKLRLEQMEARQMMAGDITASVVNGNLILTEADGQAGLDNSVVISQVAPGQIRLTGNGTSDGSKSLINGEASQVFNVTGSLNVNFGGGSDLVVFDGATRPTFQDVTLNLGAPASQPLSTPDVDQVMMFDANIRGSLTVNTGAENDWVFISNADIGDDVGIDNVKINSGAGPDTVHLKNLRGLINGSIDIQTFDAFSEMDKDIVAIEKTFAKFNVGIRTGGGNDEIYLNNVTAYQDMNLDAGAGDDKVEISYATAVDDLMADLGDGADTLTIKDTGLFVGDSAQISGGNGFDSLNTSAPVPSQAIKTSWERTNGRLVSSVFDGLTLSPYKVTTRR